MKKRALAIFLVCCAFCFTLAAGLSCGAGALMLKPLDVGNYKSCPRCGAPLQITSAGKCEYCGSIVTTGEFSWVLTDMDAVKSGIQIDNCGVLIQDDTNNGGQDNVSH